MSVGTLTGSEQRGVCEVLLARLRRHSSAGLKEAFLDHEARYRQRPPNTIRSYRLSLQRVERFVGKSIEKVTAEDLWTFVTASDYADGTVMTTVAGVHRFHDWGASTGRWKRNGIMAVKARKYTPELKPSLPRADAWAFLNGCDEPNEKRVVWLGLYVGTRVSEAARMAPEMRVEENKLRFLRSKTNLINEVPVHPELAPRLDEILASKPATARQLEHAIDRLRKRLGILTIGRSTEPVTSQAFRRTYGTELLEEGVPLWMAECLMGHRSSSMTLRAYAAIPFGRKAAEQSKVSYGHGQMMLW